MLATDVVYKLVRSRVPVTSIDAGDPRKRSRRHRVKTVYDALVRLTDDECKRLTPEQRRARCERKMANRRQANASRSQPTTSGTVPPTINVNAADSQSVAGQSNAGTLATQPPPAQPGAMLRNMMANSSTRSQTTDTLTINGTDCRRVNATTVHRANESRANLSDDGGLVDGGANGGLISTHDARILETDLIATADVVGVTSDVMSSLPIVQAASKTVTHDGEPIIAIFSNYAQRGDGGRTIHSKGQLESFGLIVDDKSSQLGGSQCIITNEGHAIPLHIRGGLPTWT